MWIDENKILSLEKRENTDAKRFLTKFLKQNLKTGISKGLQKDFQKGFKVSTGHKLLSKSIKEVAGELISTDGTILHYN